MAEINSRASSARSGTEGTEREVAGGRGYETARSAFALTHFRVVPRVPWFKVDLPCLIRSLITLRYLGYLLSKSSPL